MKAVARVLAVVSFAALVVWLIANEGGPAAGGRSPDPSARSGPAAWRTDAIWDDGRSEVSRYEVAGGEAGGTAELVVERGTGAGGAATLRVRQVCDLRRAGDELHRRASMLLGRGDGALRRITVASDGAAGLATAFLSRGRLELRPGQDEPERERNVTYPATALPQDGLPVLLRDWVTSPPPPSVDVFPALLAGDFRRLEPVTYRVTRESRELAVPAGTFRVVELRLEAAGSRLVYDFDERPPHPLVRALGADGGEYRLLASARVARLAERSTGDAGLLPAANR